MVESNRNMLRITRLFLGLFLYAVGIVMAIHANLGAAPWDVFHLGLAQKMGISLGISSIITSTVIVGASLMMRESIGCGTICNVIAIGLFIDVVIGTGVIPIQQSSAPGVAMLIAGLFVIAAATVLYMGAGYGAGPRDSLMVALAKRSGKSPGFCRVCVEATALALGWLLGGHVGIGTLISALGIGFAIQIVFGVTRFSVKDIQQESLMQTLHRLT